MAYYAVTFRFTSENTVLIEAANEQEAVNKFDSHKWKLDDVIDEVPYDLSKALKAEEITL